MGAGLILIAMALIAVPAAFAQTGTLTVQTNDESYVRGETIVVSGNVGTRLLDGTPIIIRILDGSESQKELRQIEVAQDGTFSAAFVAEGPNWTKSGDYTAEVRYGTQEEKNITFSYISDSTPDIVEDSWEVDAGSTGTFDVKYSIIGGTVSDMRIDPDNLAIVIDIVTTDTGRITVDLPREFIGAESEESKDIPYIVLIDDNQVDVTEAPVHAQVRSITAGIIEGDSQIRIIGTYVVPEFGAVMLVVIAGTAAIVAASRKMSL